MGFDCFTIRHLTGELGQHLEGETIDWVGSSSWGLGLRCSPSVSLEARLTPPGYLCLRPGRPSPDLEFRSGPERYLVGAEVADIRSDSRDRIITMRLIRRDRSGVPTCGQLIFELIHPHYQIALTREQTGEVLGVWGGTTRRPGPPRLVVGRPYRPPAPQDRLLPGTDDFPAFRAAMGRDEAEARLALPRILAGLDRAAAREVLHRAGLHRDAPAAALDEDDLARLWEVAVQLYQGGDGTGGYVWTEGGRPEFSALEPTHREATRLDSISRAILSAREEDRRAAGPGAESRAQKQALRRALKALRSKIRAVQLDLEEAGRAEELHRQGTILMAHLGQVSPGSSEVDLPDAYDITGEGRVRIRLDPRRAPADNAQRLLKSAGRYHRRLQVLPERLERLRQEECDLDAVVRRLERGEDVEESDVERWTREGARGVRAGASRREPGIHPRRYRTSQGWSVWAGRSNKENDQLTHAVAAPDDIWFHARGYPGSHVVLRREGRAEDPSGRALEEAAGIAAYWSKGKTAKKVPVSYTQVKYVTRPRGGAPGQALLRREKTLVVEPALPAQEDQA